ncbi:glycosyltransferase family 58 protein [Gelatoporia subvermispora B]|uniref:Dol-P-Man:Man(5)GlcNAc(2)-PP-Dol alpha-1,3-mannosyltransferase n=1 Tax=Ceriporiopsis subvermispora (strain B) TaxID=914234 RepID=M2RJ12_CERS8|nr:glycosyltransferase family 58 protein [Gelatoporia subvermispora B]
MASQPLAVLHKAFHFAVSLLTDRRYFSILAALVIIGDVLLTQAIVHLVPYTEIDWETYMYQTELYLEGERDYALISGPTGPIVYPAGHLYIHRILFWLTEGGKRLNMAQQIYAQLYTISVALTYLTYRRAGGVPNWLLLLLPLSKRLHSIYVLRLFNDCWTVAFVQAAILAYAYGQNIIGTALFSYALSVKMCALLYLPGLLVVLFKQHGLLATAAHVATIITSQLAIGLPFLRQYPRSYLLRSYDISRIFLYKWTVNWRFISEETFLSSRWALGLLLAHLATLVAFGLFRWCRSDGGVRNILISGIRRPSQQPQPAVVTPDHVVTLLYTSNLIGIVFARSLHYQFYSWYAHQIPFLTWRTKFPTILKLALIAGIEYAWNVYPSTTLSSGILCAANVTLLLGVWFGFPEGHRIQHAKSA